MEQNIFRSLIHLEMMFLGTPYFVTMLEMQVSRFFKACYFSPNLFLIDVLLYQHTGKEQIFT